MHYFVEGQSDQNLVHVGKVLQTFNQELEAEKGNEWGCSEEEVLDLVTPIPTNIDGICEVEYGKHIEHDGVEGHHSFPSQESEFAETFQL